MQRSNTRKRTKTNLDEVASEGNEKLPTCSVRMRRSSMPLLLPCAPGSFAPEVVDFLKVHKATVYCVKKLDEGKEDPATPLTIAK